MLPKTLIRLLYRDSVSILHPRVTVDNCDITDVMVFGRGTTRQIG